MVVAGLVDVLERHVLETLRIPAQLAVVTGVIPGQGVEVQQDPDDGGHQQGPPPLGEQGQGDVLDGAGLLQVAKVLEMVAELLEEHGDQGPGLDTVTGNRNLEKNVILNSKSNIYLMDMDIISECLNPQINTLHKSIVSQRVIICQSWDFCNK